MLLAGEARMAPGDPHGRAVVHGTPRALADGLGTVRELVTRLL
jgi:hypothetical protein